MDNNKKTPAGEDRRVDLQKMYALLCGVRQSVDRLTAQVKRLCSEREAGTDE